MHVCLDLYFILKAYEIVGLYFFSEGRPSHVTTLGRCFLLFGDEKPDDVW